MEFKDRIQEVRKDNNLTLTELAKVLGNTASAIGNWEQGTRFPNEEMLRKIADYFNVSVDYLLGRTNHRHGLIIEDRVDNNDIRMVVSDTVYPQGLTHDDVVELLQRLDKAGIQLKTNKNGDLLSLAVDGRQRENKILQNK